MYARSRRLAGEPSRRDPSTLTQPQNTNAAEALKRRLGVDYAYSNNLEISGGKLTGRVIGPVVNGQRKAELLETIAQAEGVLLDQVIAVGDGANDVLMLERAGLGIAFRAKPKLREAADTALSGAGLDAILYLLGISAREVRAIAKPNPVPPYKRVVSLADC